MPPGVIKGLWFVGLWTAGVIAVACAGFVIRLLLTL